MKITNLPCKINGLEIETIIYNVKEGRLKAIASLFRHLPSMKYAHTEKEGGWSQGTLDIFDQLLDSMEKDILEIQFGDRDSEIDEEETNLGLRIPGGESLYRDVDDIMSDGFTRRADRYTIDQLANRSIDAFVKGEREHIEYDIPTEISQF